MNNRDLFDVAVAVFHTEDFLIRQEVREYCGDTHCYRMADTFARELLLVGKTGRVRELLRKQPKRAGAFLSILSSVRDELEKAGVPPFGAPDVPLLVFSPAAVVVIEAVHEYRNKRAYLPFLLQRIESGVPAVGSERRIRH